MPLGSAFDPPTWGVAAASYDERIPGSQLVDTLSDGSIALAAGTFDVEGAQAVWAKALARRTTDPEGAITVARTLLETVCKRILNELGTPAGDKDDLPKIYSSTAEALRLAPDQHVEEPIKAILGGAMNLVNGIGTLRNRFSDAHAPGAKMPVRPAERHAKLAVNTAGAVATFLVDTYLERSKPGRSSNDSTSASLPHRRTSTK